MGIMHIEASLLIDICDVGPEEGEIPKSTSEAAIGGRVTDMSAITKELACLSTRVTKGLHASSLEDVHDVLPLLEEEALGATLNNNP
jgi:hypothetical protein